MRYPEEFCRIIVVLHKLFGATRSAFSITVEGDKRRKLPKQGIVDLAWVLEEQVARASISIPASKQP